MKNIKSFWIKRSNEVVTKPAFTLAEMMVVMLILSIVMAAFAPVMTRKSKVDLSSPWKWVEGTSDIRYGLGNANQMAMIGKGQRTAGSSGRLALNTGANAVNHLIFEVNNANAGVLRTSANSVLLGSLSGDANSTGALAINSVAIGQGTKSVTDSVAIGYQALFSNTSGFSNVATGNGALYSNTTGSNNVANGYGALYSNTTGSNNVANGPFALNSNTTGGDNVANGNQALCSNTTGNYNVANGTGALYWNTTGSNNVANGSHALNQNTTGNYNVANGSYALSDNTTGSDNVATGYYALYSNTTGYDNVANGSYALRSNTTGRYNVANGYQALRSNTTGYDNVANGYLALYKNTTGYDNVANGANALGSNTTGYYNVATGYAALYSNTTGGSNTANGSYALNKNTTGRSNTATGSSALRNNTTGSNNVANGSYALYFNTTGNHNVANGYSALYSNITGSYNSALGYEACYHVKGSNKTCIGANSGPASTDAAASNSDKVIYLGDSTTTVYIPGDLVVSGKTYLGINLDKTTKSTNYRWGDTNGSSLFVNMQSQYNPSTSTISGLGMTANGNGNIGTVSFTSDRRLKNIKGENKDGLAKINEIRTYNFTFKKDPKKSPHVGVIAQDLQKIFPNAVTKGEDGYLRIRWDEMFFAMINSIKELSAKIDNHDKEIQQLKIENAQLRAENKKLEARLNAIEAKLK